RPSRLCTDASVAWLSEGSCTDQVASASAAIMARLMRAIPPTSRSRRRRTAPTWPERKAIPSRLLSIIDIALLSLLLQFAHDLVRKPVSTFRDHALAQHRDQAMQRLGSDLLVLHHGDADIVRTRIAAVGLFAREIAARHHAHAGPAPQSERGRFTAALSRDVEPEEKPARRAAVAVAVADDPIGEIEFLAIEAPVRLDVRLVAIGGDGDALRRH